LIGVRWAAEAPAVLHPPARPVGLVGPVGAHLSEELLLQAALGFAEPLRAAARHRLRVRRALRLKALLGLAQPAAPALGGGELRRQLVPARVPMELVLGSVDRLRFLENLARELLVVEVLVARRVRVELGAVDRDDTDLGESAARAEREHLAEQAGDRLLVTLNKPCERRMVRPLLGRQHPEGDVFLAGALDHTRGPDPARVRVEQQRHHHRRVIGRPAAPVDAIGGIKRLEIHLADGVDDKPREVPLRQPLANIGRHQKRLLAITRDKALAHHEMVLNPPDDPAICDSHTRKRKPLRRRLAGHGRLGWGSDKAARPSSIDAVVTLVAVSSSKRANGLASLEPAEVRTPSRR
jgi:hypothetical protein